MYGSHSNSAFYKYRTSLLIGDINLGSLVVFFYLDQDFTAV